jgi:hypothetical protein
MFDVVYQLLNGQPGELPRRRFDDPRVEVIPDRPPARLRDCTLVQFVEPDMPERSAWLGRGELPGAARPAERVPDGDQAQTVGDEIRALVRR